MKPPLFFITLGIVGLAIFFHVHRKRLKEIEHQEFIERVKEANKPEVMLPKLRTISFVNKINANVEFTLTHFESGEEIDRNQFIISGNDSGWIPFFCPGTLLVEFNNQKLKIDLSETRKEHKIVIAANGTMTSSACDLKED
ncbi:hypothetical protein KAU11_03980 [Candidatus Babeliales bacterium]|nr:hypothetical protein [Candidatus Babeliales bacterium]